MKNVKSVFIIFLIGFFSLSYTASMTACPNSQSLYKAVYKYSPKCELVISCTNIKSNNKYLGCCEPGSVIVVDLCVL